MIVSFSDGPVTNITLTNKELSFPEFVGLLDKPSVGTKNGSYFVRGSCDEENNTRRDKNIVSAELVIIDADASSDPTVAGAPPPEKVHSALKLLGIQHAIYTSHSHGTEKGNRYRIVIPCSMLSHLELRAAVDYVLNFLELSGLPIKAADENYRWSQPWFLPRVHSQSSPFDFYSHPEGKPLDAVMCLEYFESAQIAAAETQTYSFDPHSPFLKFNKANGNPDYMLKLLEENGYQKKYKSVYKGAPSYRLLSPKSASGIPGVVLYRSEQGPYRLINYHGGHDPLRKTNPENGKPESLSAFDLNCIFNHEENKEQAINEWLETHDDRPTIDIVQGRISENVNRVIDAFANVSPPIVFQRGQMLVRVGYTSEVTNIAKCKIPSGSACIVPIEKAGMLAKLGIVAKWRKFKNQEWHTSDPCPKVNAALLDYAGEWGDIPALISISEVPLIKSDGSIVDTIGYDPESQIFIEGRFPELNIPDNPTKDDALRAVKILLEPFAEFPFVDIQDTATLLGYIFTLALRDQLVTAPLFCISSTTPGTGKGLLVECANLLVRGRDAATMPPVTGLGKEEEIRKRITSLLSMGVTSINIDNCTQPIGGDSLNMLLTASEWTDRRLGHNEILKLPIRATWAATGNNLTVRGDMVRRCLLIQLDADVESPEMRKFENPDVLKTILLNRGRYLSAIFTIIRAYRQSGGEEVEVLGRFEEWSRVVCAPVVWLGYPNPILSQARLKEDEPETDELFGILELIYGIKQDGRFTCSELIDELLKPPPPGSTVTSDNTVPFRANLVNALKQVAVGKDGLDTKRLGWYFTRFKGRVVAGFVLRTVAQPSRTKSAKRYYVEKHE